MTGTEEAIRAAWRMSRVSGWPQIQYSGAAVAMIGWKWSPQML